MKFKITVRQYADGRWGFDDHSSGTRKMVRLLSKQKAEQRALDVAVLLSNGRGDLLQVSAAELAEFRAWKAGTRQSPAIADACAEFVKLKSAKSNAYLHSLTGDLALFQQFIGPTKAIGTIMALDIQRFLTSRDVGQRRVILRPLSIGHSPSRIDEHVSESRCGRKVDVVLHSGGVHAGLELRAGRGLS